MVTLSGFDDVQCNVGVSDCKFLNGWQAFDLLRQGNRCWNQVWQAKGAQGQVSLQQLLAKKALLTIFINFLPRMFFSNQPLERPFIASLFEK